MSWRDTPKGVGGRSYRCQSKVQPSTKGAHSMAIHPDFGRKLVRADQLGNDRDRELWLCRKTTDGRELILVVRDRSFAGRRGGESTRSFSGPVVSLNSKVGQELSVTPMGEDTWTFTADAMVAMAVPLEEGDPI